MYQEILLPFDGSNGAADALHHAAEIARWADTSIDLLYVADTAFDSLTTVRTDVIDVLVQEGEETLKDAGQTLDTLGVNSRSDVVQGNPAPTIADYADRYGYDLIILPTHGRKGVSRYLLGSITEKVVRLASVPILTVRMGSNEELIFPYQDILIATDGSGGATYAAEHGLSLATAVDSTVHLLSAVEDTSLRPNSRSTISGLQREQVATDAIDELVSKAESHGISDIVRHINHGAPVSVLLDAVEANDIDAVVTGTTGRRGSNRILLGSVAERIVRAAPVPVVTVRQAK